MHGEPDWAKVLRAFYKRGMDLHEWKEPTGFGEIKPSDHGTNEYERYLNWHSELSERQYRYIREETGLSDERINDAIQWLDKHNLLRKKVPQTSEGFSYEEYCPVELTQDGFNLAQEQAQLRRQEIREDKRVSSQTDVNRAIGLLTFGLLFISFADTAVRAATVIGFSNEVITGMVVATGGVMIGMGIVLLWSGMLSPE